MTLKSVPASAVHSQARDAIAHSLRPFQEQLSSSEMLAVCAYVVGQMIALQDPRTMTPAQAMELVSANIQQGNLCAINELVKPEGSA